ncbi:MAG: tetratricopeptide repeat protein, partial [Bacteroidetes bacterium]|nr:tetratricopeptide repeat protein [Bacteroidota bacterium]
MNRFIIVVFTIVCPMCLISQDYKQYLTLSYAEIDSLEYVANQTGDINQSILYLKAGREKASNEFGDRDTLVVRYLDLLASYYYVLEDLDQALSLYTLSYEIREEKLGKEHPDFATSSSFLGDLFVKLGKPDEALPLLIQAKDIREKVLGKRHPEYAMSLYFLGVYYENRGDFNTAISLYEQAKNIRAKALGKEDPYYLATLNNLAVSHYRLGHYNQTLELFHQVREVKRKIYGEEHYEYANALVGLAFIYGQLGKNEESLKLQIQALEIKSKIYGEDHLDHANTLFNLARYYDNLEEFDKALPFYLKSQKIYRERLSEKHSDHPRVFLFLANLFIRWGDYGQAWNCLYQAMNLNATKTLNHSFDKPWYDSLSVAPYPSNKHLEIMISALDVTYELLEMDESIIHPARKQSVVADLANHLVIRVRNQVANEEDKLRMLSKSHEWTMNSLEVLDPAEDAEKAFHIADKNKSVLLLQAMKSEKTNRFGELPDSLVERDEQLQHTRNQLQAQLLENRPEN